MENVKLHTNRTTSLPAGGSVVQRRAITLHLYSWASGWTLELDIFLHWCIYGALNHLLTFLLTDRKDWTELTCSCRWHCQQQKRSSETAGGTFEKHWWGRETDHNMSWKTNGKRRSIIIKHCKWFILLCSLILKVRFFQRANPIRLSNPPFMG